MEEFFQKLIRLAPSWARRILTICALAGAAISSLHSVFAPAIDTFLAGVIEPQSITFNNATFASLWLIVPIWLTAHWFAPNRRPTVAVLHTIDVVEAAIQRVSLEGRERVTVRRGIIKALADAAKQNVGQGIKPEIVIDAVNSEVAGLVEGSSGRIA